MIFHVFILELQCYIASHVLLQGNGSLKKKKEEVCTESRLNPLSSGNLAESLIRKPVVCRFKLISKQPAARNVRGGENVSP